MLPDDPEAERIGDATLNRAGAAGAAALRGRESRVRERHQWNENNEHPPFHHHEPPENRCPPRRVLHTTKAMESRSGHKGVPEMHCVRHRSLAASGLFSHETECGLLLLDLLLLLLEWLLALLAGVEGGGSGLGNDDERMAWSTHVRSPDAGVNARDIEEPHSTRSCHGMQRMRGRDVRTKVRTRVRAIVRTSVLVRQTVRTRTIV